MAVRKSGRQVLELFGVVTIPVECAAPDVWCGQAFRPISLPPPLVSAVLEASDESPGAQLAGPMVTMGCSSLQVQSTLRVEDCLTRYLDSFTLIFAEEFTAAG